MRGLQTSLSELVNVVEFWLYHFCFAWLASQQSNTQKPLWQFQLQCCHRVVSATMLKVIKDRQTLNVLIPLCLFLKCASSLLFLSLSSFSSLCLSSSSLSLHGLWKSRWEGCNISELSKAWCCLLLATVDTWCYAKSVRNKSMEKNWGFKLKMFWLLIRQCYH